VLRIFYIVADALHQGFEPTTSSRKSTDASEAHDLSAKAVRDIAGSTSLPRDLTSLTFRRASNGRDTRDTERARVPSRKAETTGTSAVLSPPSR